MIIRITLYYKNKPAPLSRLVKVSTNWLIIVEKTKNETNIKSGLGDVFYTFKNIFLCFPISWIMTIIVMFVFWKTSINKINFQKE